MSGDGQKIPRARGLEGLRTSRSFGEPDMVHFIDPDIRSQFPGGLGGNCYVCRSASAAKAGLLGLTGWPSHRNQLLIDTYLDLARIPQTVTSDCESFGCSPHSLPFLGPTQEEL